MMKRTSFRRPTYSRATVPLTPLDGCRGRYSAVGGGVVAAPKPKAHRDQRIRDSARGELCLMRLPGCPGGTERTIWSHYRGSAGGKGMALKSHDIAGCYACTWCDAAYDGGIFRPVGMTKADVDLAWHEAHIRSLGRLHEKGLL